TSTCAGCCWTTPPTGGLPASTPSSAAGWCRPLPVRAPRSCPRSGSGGPTWGTPRREPCASTRWWPEPPPSSTFQPAPTPSWRGPEDPGGDGVYAETGEGVGAASGGGPLQNAQPVYWPGGTISSTLAFPLDWPGAEPEPANDTYAGAGAIFAGFYAEVAYSGP